MSKQEAERSVLEVLGQDPNAIDEFEYLRIHEPLKKQICICGHGMLRHDEFSPGTWECLSGKMYCPCQHPQAVLLVEDARYFIRKTEGVGPGHALFRGLRGLEKSGKKSKLLVRPACQKCGTEEGAVMPAAVNAAGRLSSKPEKLNVLICENCVLEVKSKVS